MLLEPRQGAEGIDHAIVQIELPFGDVTGVVRHRMGHIVTRHGGHRQDGDRTGNLVVTGLFVAPCQLGVEVTDIAPVGGHMLHGDADLLQGIGVGGHICEQHQHPLALFHGEAFGHRQRHIRHQQPLHHRIGALMHKHHRARQYPRLFKRLAEEMVVIEDQPHAAKHHNVGIRMGTDLRQQPVVGLPGYREDGNFLALHQTVEHIDHGHISADHA